jgi:hypothetical protein
LLSGCVTSKMLTLRRGRLGGLVRNRTFTMIKAVIVAFVLLLFASATYGQRQISINVNDPRPLAKATEQVEQSLGVPINY